MEQQEHFGNIEERIKAYQVLCRKLPVLGKGILNEANEGIAPENRVINNDFGTLLCLYEKEGIERSIRREGIFSIAHELPGRGRYHKHEFIEVFYVAEGEFEQILLGEKRHFVKGQVVITDQNCEHADYLLQKDAAVLFLWIRPQLMDVVLEAYDGKNELEGFLFHALRRQKKEQSFLVLQTKEQETGIGRILECLVEEDYGREPGSDEIIRGNLIRLLQLLCTNYALQLYSSDRESREKMLLYELERCIRLNPAHVTLGDLEKLFCYHRNYYNLLLKKYCGKGFKEYVQEIRIAKAKELLTDTQLSVKQVAAAVGYENTSFFYELFFRAEQTSPMEYRRRPVLPDAVDFTS